MDTLTRTSSIAAMDTPTDDPWAHSPMAALATVLHAAERARATDGFFADPDEAGELERSIDAVRAMLGMGIGADDLLAGR